MHLERRLTPASHRDTDRASASHVSWRAPGGSGVDRIGGCSSPFHSD